MTRITHQQVAPVTDTENAASLEWFGQFGGSSARDALPTWNFEMRLADRTEPLACKVQVEDDAAALAHSGAERTGTETKSLMELLKRLDAFIERHGKTSRVVSMPLPWGSLGDGQVAEVINCFAGLWFESQSSLRLNSKGDELSGRGFYPDTLLFQPAELDKTFWARRRAESELA